MYTYMYMYLTIASEMTNYATLDLQTIGSHLTTISHVLSGCIV